MIGLGDLNVIDRTAIKRRRLAAEVGSVATSIRTAVYRSE
jgi:hypothetical protein